MKYLPLLVSPLLICTLSSRVTAASVIQSHMVKDNNLNTVDSGSNPSAFTTMGGRVYFRATTPETGQELFVTDGISSEPQLARDFAAGPADSNPQPSKGSETIDLPQLVDSAKKNSDQRVSKMSLIPLVALIGARSSTPPRSARPK